MNKYLKILIILSLVILIPIALFYGGFALMLVYNDQANYYSEGTSLGSSGYYNKVVENAKETGYKTEFYYVNAKENEIQNLRPGAIEGLDSRLGSDYLVNSLDIYYSNSSWISISFLNSQKSTVSLQNEYQSTENMSVTLSKREWIAQKLKILFDLNENESAAYLPAENIEGNDIHYYEITINKTPDFAAIREYLVEQSTNSTFDANTSGEGWCSETFYNESQKLGHINYIVPNVEISHREGWRIYTVKLDRLGGLSLKVSLGPASSGNTIPEKEYRAVFKRMFADLGLPSEKVDELEFEYSRGVW